MFHREDLREFLNCLGKQTSTDTQRIEEERMNSAAMALPGCSAGRVGGDVGCHLHHKHSQISHESTNISTMR